MTESDLQLRMARIEKEVEDLYVLLEKLRDTSSDLTVTIALLEQTIRTVQEVENQRGSFNQKVAFFVIGGAISAVMAFVIKGGLVL